MKERPVNPIDLLQGKLDEGSPDPRSRRLIAPMALALVAAAIPAKYMVEGYIAGNQPPKPEFACTTVVDPGETVWEIAADASINPDDPTAVMRIMNRILYDNNLTAQGAGGAGTELGLTTSQCANTRPEQITGILD